MADIYVTIREQPPEMIEAVAAAMSTRAGEPEMQAIAAAYLAPLRGPGGRVVEIGCGNGATPPLLLAALEPETRVGVDPCPGLLARADPALARDPRVTLREGEPGATGEAEGAADLVVAHAVYSHLPDPDAALAEAFRILRPGGRIAIFDGDSATTTVALFAGDPLQTAVGSVLRDIVHDPYVMRGLPARA